MKVHKKPELTERPGGFHWKIDKKESLVLLSIGNNLVNIINYLNYYILEKQIYIYI
jgi:hypothetical protein